MNIHKNARLTPRRRQELAMRVEAGEPLKHAARSGDSYSGRRGRRSRIFNRKDTHAPPSAGDMTSAPSDHYFHSQTFVVTFP